MAIGSFNNILIRGMACAVPKNYVDNKQYYEKFGREAVDKFIKMVGVRKRHIALPEQTMSDLCYVAASRLLNSLGWERESIDAIVVATQTPDYDAPSNSCILQYRLGLTENCLAFDISLGCSSYIYGLFVCCSLMQNPSVKRVLFLNGDMNDQKEDEQFKAMLFGDAGTATALEQVDFITDSMNFLLKTDGSRYDKLILPNTSWRHRARADQRKGFLNFEMDGPAVYDFTLFDVPATLKEFLKVFDKDIVSYDYCALHQSNLMAMRQIAKFIKLPKEKMLVALDRFGNTNGASVLLAIVDLYEKQEIKQNLKLLLSGFGIGFSWGVLDLVLDSAAYVLPIIYTDDYFREAY